MRTKSERRLEKKRGNPNQGKFKKREEKRRNLGMDYKTNKGKKVKERVLKVLVNCRMKYVENTGRVQKKNI